MVQILLGPEKKPLSFHKTLIRRYSAYFSCLFGSGFQEGKEGIVHFAEVDETSCRIFQAWLYMQNARGLHGPQKDRGLNIGLAMTSEDANDTPDPHEESPLDVRIEDSDSDSEPTSRWPRDSFEFSWESLREPRQQPSSRSNPNSNVAKNSEEFCLRIMNYLVRLYIFADAYECPALRNDIMSAITYLSDRADSFPCLHFVPWAFSHLPSSSTLCQYLTKRTARHWNPDEPVKNTESLSREFLLEVLQINARRASSETYGQVLDEELAERCQFHEHAAVEEKRLCQSRKKKELPLIVSLISLCLEAVGSAQEDNLVLPRPKRYGRPVSPPTLPLSPSSPSSPLSSPPTPPSTPSVFHQPRVSRRTAALKLFYSLVGRSGKKTPEIGCI